MKLNKLKLLFVFTLLNITTAWQFTCGAAGAAASAGSMPEDHRDRAVVAGVFSHLAYAKLKPGPLEDQELEGFNPAIRGLLPEGASIISDTCHDAVGDGAEAAAEVLLASTSGLRAINIQLADGSQHLSFRGTKTPYGALTDVVLLACALDHDPKAALLDLATKMAKDYAPEIVPEAVIKSSLEQVVEHLGEAASKSLESSGGGEAAAEEEDNAWSVTGFTKAVAAWLPASTTGDDSWMGIAKSLLWEAGVALAESGHEAFFDSLPEDMKMALKAIGSGSSEDFKRVMRHRLEIAVEQAVSAIREANTAGTLKGISGHSLGGISAELAAVKLIAAGELDPAIEVTCFCSPGGRELFEFMGIAVPEESNVIHIARAGDLISRMGSVSASHSYTIDGLDPSQVAAAYEWLEESAPMHALVAHGITPTVWALLKDLAKRT